MIDTLLAAVEVLGMVALFVGLCALLAGLTREGVDR